MVAHEPIPRTRQNTLRFLDDLPGNENSETQNLSSLLHLVLGTHTYTHDAAVAATAAAPQDIDIDGSRARRRMRHKGEPGNPADYQLAVTCISR